MNSYDAKSPKFKWNVIDQVLSFIHSGFHVFIVQLGPSESPRTKFQFGLKLNTKVAFNTTTHPPPPKTFKVVPGKLEAQNCVETFIQA